MKRLSFIITTLFFVNLAFGQSDLYTTFKVTNYTIDGINYDDVALNADVCLSFYMCDENTLCFANHWRNADSQSHGSVYALQQREIPGTTTTYAATEYKFTWSFQNTYDNINGAAAVTFHKIYIGSTVKFTAEIVVMDTNEVLAFQGYLESEKIE